MKNHQRVYATHLSYSPPPLGDEFQLATIKNDQGADTGRRAQVAGRRKQEAGCR